MTKSAVAYLVAAGLTLVPPAASASDARSGVTVSRSVAVALSAPLSELAEEAALTESDQESGEIREVNNLALPHKGDATAPSGGLVVDPVRQTSFPPNILPNVLTDPIANFEGIGVAGSIPPDTNGAVGPNHYVQTVNSRVEVWDKNGTVVVAATAINSLFSGLPAGDRCKTNNDGDPIVLYDQLADRFVISQFAVLPFPGTHEYNQCIAVSETGDPTGSYWLYDFVWATNRLNDYPHFGIWPDGYYMSMHQFDPHRLPGRRVRRLRAGHDALRSDRAADSFRLNNARPSLRRTSARRPGRPHPSPTAGTPNHFVEVDDGRGSAPVDTMRIWNVSCRLGESGQLHLRRRRPAELHVAGDATVLVTPAKLHHHVEGCVPAASHRHKLDPISGGRLMYRASRSQFSAITTRS